MMSKRFYLSPLVDVPSPLGGTMKLAKVLSDGTRYTGCVQVVNPAGNWALVLTESTQHATLVQDTDNRDLPELSLDIKWAAMGTQAQRKLENALTRFGIPASVFTTPTPVDSYRELIERIGALCDPAFTTLSFDI